MTQFLAKVVCSKNVFSRERVKPFFLTLTTIISHVFPENVIEIPHVVHNIRRFFLSVVTIFIDFSDFLSFPCYKETYDFSI